MIKTIAFGCDHAGVTIKDEILAYLESLNIDVLDFGTNSRDSVDYPDFAYLVSEAVAKNQADCGLLICGSGIGMSIAANRNQLIRAALCHHEYDARVARAHNDANVLCLGSRVIGLDLAKVCIKTFIETPFEGGRHQRRVDKLSSC